MSDLVGNPKDRFSRVAAHIFPALLLTELQCMYNYFFGAIIDIYDYFDKKSFDSFPIIL